jgi:hypothetical protein
MKQGSGLFSNVPALNRNIRSFRDFIGFILLISVLSLLMPLILYAFDLITQEGLIAFSGGFVAFVLVPVSILFFPAEWWQTSPKKRLNARSGRILGRFLDVSPRNFFMRAYLISIYTAIVAFFGILIVVSVLVFGGIVVAIESIKRPFLKRSAFNVPGIILIYLFVLIFAAGLIAPFRALIAAVFFTAGERLFPVTGDFLAFLTAYERGARFDIAFGIAGAFSAAVWTCLDAFWRLRQARQVRNLPTSKVSAAAIGLVELKGVARSTSSPEEPIMRLRWDMWGAMRNPFEPEQKLSPFYLEDDSGRVLIDPSGCRIRAGWVTDIASMLMVREVVLSNRVQKIDEDDSVMRTLMDGDTVYIIGNAETDRNAPIRAKDSRRLVVRPSEKPTLGESLWRVFFGSSKLSAGRDIHNVFFISDTDEIDARRRILNGFRTVWTAGLLWLIISVWLSWSGLHRLENYEAVKISTPIEGGVLLSTDYRLKADRR